MAEPEIQQTGKKFDCHDYYRLTTIIHLRAILAHVDEKHCWKIDEISRILLRSNVQNETNDDVTVSRVMQSKF